MARAWRGGESFSRRAEKSAGAGLCLAAALFAAFAFVNLALAYTFPPLTGRVVDSANIIPEAVSDRVTAKLASREAESGIQLVVATVKSLEADYIERYANALFRTWGLGEKQKNNGVLLLVAPNDRKMRIEVGYGLEGTLTDVLSKIIITNAMASRFKAGDYGGGIERGVDDIITILTTDSSEWEKRPQLRIVRQDTTLGNLAPWIALGLFVFFFFGLPILGFLGVIGTWHGFSGGLVRVGGSGGRWSDGGFSGSGGSSGGSGSGGDFSRRRRIVGGRRRLGELVMARLSHKGQLSAEDRHRVGDAIKSAEATTAGEIVCVLARASSDYRSYATAWSALLALIAPWSLIALTNLSVHEILLVQIVVFVVLFFILSESPLSRVLVPRRARRAEAHRAAMEQFMIRGMARKQNRAGVLIFVSLAEHYARIVADDGIASKVRQSVWQDAIDALLERAGAGEIVDGFVIAVEKCGRVLAEHFPPESDDKDELPDRIYLI